MNKAILVFAGKNVGLELVRFLLDESYPVHRLVLASELDYELNALAVRSGIQVDFYSKKIQREIIEDNENYDWILNLWSPHILKDGLLALASKRLNIHPSLLPNGGGNDNAMWTIRKNLRPGISLIEMERGIDVGAIYDQVEISYDFPISGKELNNLLQLESFTFFKKSWSEIYLGSKIPVKKALTSYHTRAQTNIDRVRDGRDIMSLREFISWGLAHDFSPNTTAEVVIDGIHYRLTLGLEKVV